MLKKFISALVLICVMTCCFSFNVFAETTVDDEIALTNLYTNKISTNITRSSSKKISYVYYIHRVKVKTDKDNQYTIDDVYYRINQNK